MIDVAEEKSKVYGILFEHWKSRKNNRISITAEDITRSAFRSNIKEMSLAQLNFCVTQAIHHLLDYCELSDPSIDLEIARSMISKFVIKATGYESFWEQLSEAGLVTIESFDEWI